MYLIYLAAFIAACGAAKLDRTYLPPPSAALAGGSPGSLQVPLTRAFDQASQNVPPGGFINEHQGVVVEAATAGTRASSQKSGLGGSRDSYGSTDSKVGAAAFRTPTHQSPNHMPNFESVHGGDLNPDLSAFYQPMTSYRPGNVQIIRDYVSNTIKYHNDIDINKFNYGFETNNGIKASESGVAINGVQVQGGYSYTGDDGRVYSVSYTADENGFRAHGSHLPTPPPIPIEILRSLEQNAKDEAAGNFDDGSYDARKYNDDGDYTKSDANGEYNDRQSNKFGKRPGSTDGIGTFNQNQQAFVTSNFNGQFGFIHDTSKDKFSGANDFNIMNNRNTFPKNEHNNQFINNGLGSRNEYLPPNRGQFESMISAGGNKDSFNISQPILQQKLQAQDQLNIVRPNSFETSPGIFSQAPFNSQISSLPSNNYNNQGSISGFSDKNISPSISSQLNNKPLSENPASSNILNQNPMIMQQSTLAPNNNKPILTQDSISQSFASVSAYSPQTQSTQQFISTNSPLQSTQNLNIRLPTTQLSSASSGSFNPSVNIMGQSQYTHIPVSSFDTSFTSTIPTVQPQKILTTPFETPKMREPSTLLDSGKAELLNATTASDFTVINQNIRLPSTQLSSAPSVSFIPSVNTIEQPQYTQTSISSFDTSFSSVVPTVQPQITLSTPFEAPKMGEPSNLLDSEKMELLNAKPKPKMPNTNQNIHLPTTHLSSTSSEYFHPSMNTIGQTQYPNAPSFGTDTSFSSSSLSGVPTVQPQITLTTPFETPKRNPSTVLDSSKTELFNATTVPEFTVTENQSSKLLVQTISNKEQLPTNDFSGFSTSSFDTRPQSTSQPFDNTQTTQISDDSKPQVTQVIFVSNRQGDSVSTYTQGPTYNGQSNKFNGETQAPDQSYTYKQPPIPFNTPFVIQQSSNFPTGLSQVTQSLTTPQDSTSTTQYQTQSTLNNSPNPTTLKPNISSNTLKDNEHEKTTLQATNGITQASISPFPSTIFTDSSNIKIPLQQSELSTPSQSAFPQSSTISVTATAEIVSTTSDDQKDYTQNHSFVEDKLNDGINKINNEQYSSEIYQYNKPDQGLPPQPQKDDDKFSIKTERPQFAVSSSQFGQEGSTISMDQNNIQRDTQKPQATFEAQSYSPVSEQSFSTRFGEQTSTQVTQVDLNSNEYTISQSQKHTSPGIGPNYKPTTFFPSTVPTNTLNTDKLNSQTSTTLSDIPTFGPQFTSQFVGSGTKETTSSYFQQPNQQTETQFNYQPSTLISGVSQTTPEIKDDTQLTSISQIFGTQSTAQFGQENFDNKATTLPQFQQTVTQFTKKPSTSISNVDHSSFSGFNTQNPDKQISFSTSFIPTSTEEPTQFGTQDNQGSFENKQTTIYHYQTPSHQSSTTYSELSSLIPSTAQTETPPNQTTKKQFNYQPSTLISGASQTTPEIKDDTQLTSISQRFGTQSTTQFGQENFDNKATTLPQFQQIVTQFTNKPSTSISNVDHSTFSGFNAQNPDNQISFSTSFVPTSTEEPTQFGIQDNHGSFENIQTTIYHYQTPSHQSSTTYSEPSTLIPSATQTETPPGTTQFGEIYDYKKPTESLIIPQNENNAQFGLQSNMGTQTIPIFQKENPTIQFAQQTQQPQYNMQPSTQLTEKETTQSHMTQSEVVTGIEYNTGSTLVPSLPKFQTTSNTQVPDQTSTTGEIYDYTKPEQGLSPQSEGENGQIGQKIHEQQNGERTTIPVRSTFETKQTTISQSTEAPTSTSATFQTQSSLNSQTTNASQSVLTQETLSETKPSDSPPQFSFYSACCKGSRNQGSISANEILNTQNKNMDQVADKNLVEEKQNLNVPVLQDAQKGSQTYAGIGEEFGGPRNPPSFDETGYHY